MFVCLQSPSLITLLVLPDADESVNEGEHRRNRGRDNYSEEAWPVFRCVFGLEEKRPDEIA